jgi:hypothetical protein
MFTISFQAILVKNELGFQHLTRIGRAQGRTGHITRWEKSHGAPLVWGPLRQSEAPQHHVFFFFLDHLNSWEFPVVNVFTILPKSLSLNIKV